MSALGLAEAKTHLNITVPTYDSELQTFIDAAEAAVAQRVGPLSTATVTARVPGYSYALYLPVYPVASLTSITVAGSATTLTLADLYVQENTGQVTYTAGGAFSSANYDVVYTVGRSPVPSDLLMAVKKLLRFMWNDQRGGGVRPGQSPETFAPGALLPSDVRELLEPYELLPGLA